MKKKTVLAAFALLVLTVVPIVLVGACSQKEEPSSWDVSAEDGTITASLLDDGDYGYILKLEGNGKLKEFSSATEAPWYDKSGRITQIIISEGITSIGNNAFTYCHYVKTVILPESVVFVGEYAFSEKSRLHAAAETEEEETMKILFIGNSFTYVNDIPALFEQIAAAAGKRVIAESITRGAHNLSKFADAADEYGMQVDAALTACSDYDIIVLQEQSTRPLANYELFLEGAAALKEKADRTQKDCKVYLYATWGYPKQTKNVSEMSEQLRTAYDNAAEEIGAKVCYVGTAFGTVYENDKDILLFAEDEQHPSYAGSYLSACVHAATLLGIDPREAAYNGELEASVAEILKNVAYDTVFGS